MLKYGFFLAFFVSACGAENTSRIGFCDESGSLAEDVFIDLGKKSFVIGDSFDIGSTDCKTKDNFCFYAHTVNMEFPRTGEDSNSQKNMQKWGYINWVVDYDKKTLAIEVNHKNSSKDVFYSCHNSHLIFR